jgi:hypothetical protein
MSVVDEIEARLPQLTAPLRLLFDVEGAGSPFIANVRGALAAAIPQLASALDELAFVVATLEARGLAPVVQAVLARSFEYYSGSCSDLRAGRRICWQPLRRADRADRRPPGAGLRLRHLRAPRRRA